MTYITEREGQIDFYERFLPLVNPSLTLDDILADSNDGVLNGNILEFKLNVDDLNAALFQTVKYLSARRIKGKPVPANILIVDLNAALTYLYKSEDYLTDIEKVYTGAASKATSGFSGRTYTAKYDYSKDLDAASLIQCLREKSFTKIHLDDNCIVGWATAYYETVPNARKEDFIGDDTGQHKTLGEIRNPNVFRDYIHPYVGKTNVQFQYLMDKLNDRMLKKNLGSFYTPSAYAEKSHELLRLAIDRVPEGNDYVIIDRCAGTGNLEKGLTDEELSHCILSTIEYYEYKVLQEILGSKVRHIIPPVEADDTFQAGLVKGADALSKEYVENPVIKQYLDDPHCSILLFENVPYLESSNVEHQKKGYGKESAVWKKSFVAEEMKKEVKGTANNDLGNAFIWSAFRFYLRQPTDSYIVYSPVKYWKAQHLINQRFLGGFAFNRRWFHTNIDACIMCALWTGEKDNKLDSIDIEGFDYDSKTDSLVSAGLLKVSRIHTKVSTAYYDKRPIPEENRKGILCGMDGREKVDGVKFRLKPASGDGIIGYMVTDSSGFDNPDLGSSLLSAGRYNGNGFYLRNDNYLSKLPLFAMSRYITYNRGWTERARIMKSGDGADRFHKDAAKSENQQWLLKCLLFTCVEMQNHMRTFTGSDGHFYRNELCLDTTNGETLASVDLNNLVRNEAEERIFNQWNMLLEAAKKTKEYDPSLTYGVYQIFAEIDTSYRDENGATVWNNVEVHSALQTLKALVKDYYNTEIVPTLFDYEFLK